ncbi:NAD-dependent histone deacetylase sirtuin-1 [Drosophila biarmipes]|uniref:NAD-dependent histone deacetylase sirtuin-1 n=1 Tax=Drosophila biarmipes TaxID=125945 RepID=UPI0007E852C6|nr:NAD-dependent histone deacetylase sirtuin-1 [Drosophila biarmipes]XP_050741304.1 NAD-dependent histone deacetylase sirtuin-1 [Drosophila biarmipes]
MMENYEEIRLGHIKAKDLGDQVPDAPQFYPPPKFDFGAEILAPSSTEAESSAEAKVSAATTATSELAGKANGEIKTKTLAAKEEQEIGANLEQENQNLPKPSSENDEEDEEEEEDDDEEEDDEEEVTGTSNEDEDSSSDCSSSVGPDWKLRWLQREFYTGRVPRQVIASIMPHFATGLAADTDDSVLWDYLAHLLNEPKRRNKLASVNTFDDVISLVKKSQKIIVLTGAGVSVSCGIPDFRSTNGIYARLAHDFPDLPDPQAMFDINYFKRDPRPFYKFAREIYPGEFQPSPCHRFIKMLETKGKLLRNYTQNIDTLERVAGIQRVIECHGSFSTASCTKCRFKCNADALRADIFAQRIPVCPQCQPNKKQSVDASVAVTEEELRQLVENGIMKPDIVFFGEGLPDEYHTVMATDKDVCDLLIVIGSSLKVRPVAHIPSSIPGTVPQILINREQLHHLKFDVELLGDSDVIINQICHRLSDSDECWRQLCCDESILSESKELMPPEHYHHHHHHHASHHLHHHRHCSSESEQQSQLDTDTQSLKSNSSADYILGSAGTCSDSGFESSTFTSGKRSTAADAAAIERIKSDILVELNETTALSCDRLAVGDPSKTVESYRHLSIDSSKDSGIEQCDNEGPPNYVRPSNLVQETKTVAPSLTPIPQQRGKRQTAAERLQPGTFYSHTNNYSYVFPGAQVFWDNDYSDDDDEEEDRGHNKHGDLFGNGVANYDDDDEDACDLNAVPLSPLLPPSLEAHIVTEIVNGVDEPVTNSSPGQKRPASNLQQPPTAIPTLALERETPPPKKRRPSEEDEQQIQTESSEESPPPGQLEAV